MYGFWDPEKTVQMEICTIRGAFMIQTHKLGIYEIKSPFFFIKHRASDFFYMPGFTFYIVFLIHTEQIRNTKKKLAMQKKKELQKF